MKYGCMLINANKNVVWHIETNRKVLGDQKTLDDVLIALKRMTSEAESVNLLHCASGNPFRNPFN